MRISCKKFIGQFTSIGSTKISFYVDADSKEELQQIAANDRLKIVEVARLHMQDNLILVRTKLGSNIENDILRKIYNSNKYRSLRSLLNSRKNSEVLQ